MLGAPARGRETRAASPSIGPKSTSPTRGQGQTLPPRGPFKRTRTGRDLGAHPAHTHPTSPSTSLPLHKSGSRSLPRQGDRLLQASQGAHQPLAHGCFVFCEQRSVQSLVCPAPVATHGWRSIPAERCPAPDTFPHALPNHSRCPKQAMERSRGQAIKPPICLNP